MNINPPEHFVEFFRSRFVFVVLIASVIASCAVLSTRPVKKIEQYKIEAEIRQTAGQESDSVQGEQFVFHSGIRSSGPNLLELADSFGDIVLSILFLPSFLAVLILVSVSTVVVPNANPLFLEAAASIAFVFYTAYYWLSISYLIYNPPGDWGPFHEEFKLPSILDAGKK
ncbi:MAG: hypothetical protein DWQ47_07995 [Acidobacteria bacterium]|nr:MAG: hypothetical protein DWQ32_16095 [Acidobacteriota bacterium]REJ99145.1 MAG: hypothetical protein DWQ38_13880 [Acidobacteriota bacterium]REK16134.1 MAG: hypothetical protein DWQ43_03805 [Acidobacteriota bacterium]REK43815.1 MAG: hypothetical protein DWQ47_07995 [Acidobacteriota bacterium]